MDTPTSSREAIAKTAVEPVNQNLEKGAWVTPVVREYDPADVSKAAPGGVGADIGIYS